MQEVVEKAVSVPYGTVLVYLPPPLSFLRTPLQRATVSSLSPNATINCAFGAS